MQEDFFAIDLPNFVPNYSEDKKYGFTKHKNALWDLLNNTTDGYCMYCFDRIFINGQKRGQIEHGIEKSMSVRYLTDCIPNLGIACSNCNQKYKKCGEKNRKLSPESINNFESEGCKMYDCKTPCERYKKLRMEYIKNGKIIIHPFEAKLSEDGEELLLQYDLLTGKYIPSTKNAGYTPEELEVLEKHIQLFQLNSPTRKNNEIIRYCKNVIDNRSIMKGVEYNNKVVDLFRSKLEQLDIEKVVKICELVYMKLFINTAS